MTFVLMRNDVQHTIVVVLFLHSFVCLSIWVDLACILAHGCRWLYTGTDCQAPVCVTLLLAHW